MKSMMKWIAAALALTTVACGTAEEKSGDEFKETTFELRNVGDSSIWIGTEFPLKIVAGDTEYLPYADCSCRECPLSAGAPATRTEHRPDETWSHTWDGNVIGGDEECPDLTSMIGENLIAEFCYGTNIDDVGGITDIECVRKPFTVGDGLVVAAEVEHVVEVDDSIPVIIENATDNPIYAQMVDQCGAGTFFTVRYGEEEIRLGSSCSFCECGADQCAICDAACEAPSVAEVAPGATAEGSFSLTYRKLYDDEGGQCVQLQDVPAGTLTATICFGTSVEDEDTSTIADEQCDDVDFTIEDDEVRLVVASATTGG